MKSGAVADSSGGQLPADVDLEVCALARVRGVSVDGIRAIVYAATLDADRRARAARARAADATLPPTPLDPVEVYVARDAIHGLLRDDEERIKFRDVLDEVRADAARSAIAKFGERGGKTAAASPNEARAPMEPKTGSDEPDGATTGPERKNDNAAEFDLGNGRLLRWTPNLVSLVFIKHDRETGEPRESPTEIVPGLFRPLRRIVVEGETYYAVEFAPGAVRTGTFQDIFDRLEKVEGRILARAFGRDVVAQLLYRFCRETEVGYPTWGFYADKNGAWVEARNPTPVKDEQARVAEEVAPAVAYEPKRGDLAAYAAFDAFYKLPEILPIRGLSGISPFALELRRAKVLVPHVLAWSQEHNLGKTTAELSASDAAFGREHMSASSLNSEFRFPANVDACCGPIVIDEAERFAWDKWGGELKIAAESVNVSKRGHTSLRQDRYLSRSVLLCSANSCSVASPALLVRFFILHFAEDQAQARRLRRAEYDAAFARLAPVGPAVAREIARAYPAVKDLLAAIGRYADEIDAECAKQGIEVRDPRRSKSWALVRLGLNAWASLASRLGDSYPIPGLEKFVAEVVKPVEAGTFESEVTPLSAFRSWLESYKVAAITRKFEVRGEGDRRSGEGTARILPLEIDSLRGEGRIFEDGFLEPESKAKEHERVPGDWITTSLLDRFNREQPRADLRFTDLKDLQLTAIRDTDLLESDILEPDGKVPRHPFVHTGRQRSAFVPSESWAADHPANRVPGSGGRKTKQSDLKDAPGPERVPLGPVGSGQSVAGTQSGPTPDPKPEIGSRDSTDEKLPVGTPGPNSSAYAREERALGGSDPAGHRPPAEPPSAIPPSADPARSEAATRELRDLIRSTGTADRDTIHRVLSLSGYSDSEISAAIGAVCGAGLVRQEPNGALRWKEAEA